MVKGTDKFEGAGIRGTTYQQALDITSAFLEWYQRWLEENVPTATNPINACEQLQMDLGGTDFDELMGDADEEE